MAERKPLDPYTLRWCASALAAGVDKHALPETVRDYADHFKRCARALKPAKRTKR